MPNVETVLLLSLEERTVITWKEFKEDFLEKVIAKVTKWPRTISVPSTAISSPRGILLPPLPKAHHYG